MTDKTEWVTDEMVAAAVRIAEHNPNLDAPSPWTVEWYRNILRAALAAAPTPPAQEAQPLFWYRPIGKDGLYEGPHHADSMGGKMRRDERPGEWVALYTLPPDAARRIAELEAERDALRTANQSLATASIVPDHLELVAKGTEAERDRLREALTRIPTRAIHEDSVHGTRLRCPGCGHAWGTDESEHHEESCPSMIARAALGRES